MAEPLSKSQQSLRGRKIADMTDHQLRDWIQACEKMENWVGHAKARRGWRLSGVQAEKELDRRNSTSKAR
jgi:hypothetical protein